MLVKDFIVGIVVVFDVVIEKCVKVKFYEGMIVCFFKGIEVN